MIASIPWLHSATRYATDRRLVGFQNIPGGAPRIRILFSAGNRTNFAQPTISGS